MYVVIKTIYFNWIEKSFLLFDKVFQCLKVFSESIPSFFGDGILGVWFAADK